MYPPDPPFYYHRNRFQHVTLSLNGNVLPKEGSNKLLPCRIRIEVLANDVDYARTCVYWTFARPSLYVHDTMSTFT